VAGATKIEWRKDGGLSIFNEPMKDPTWYAFSDFHKCITENKKPMIDVAQGAKAAVTVHLANNALYTHTVQKWKPEYDF
ncbi:MAG: gfo/Idh/MocA family oxidoreductase, partial [Ginsengibacter sp.]